jgi:NADH:ubiquinone oxidoreductase subunit 6 (subunit J)
MSSDANRLYNFASFIHRPVVDLPLSAVISVAALWVLLGPSALAGLTIIILTGPMTAFISSYMIKEQLALNSATDHRTQATNEVKFL